MSAEWYTRPIVVYSRVSNTVQSTKRQTDKTNALLKQYGVNPDNVERVSDDGVSAYTGANINGGNLGLLLSRPDIASLSVVVENLDRLSRQHVMIAVNTFSSLINGGCVVVTVSPFVVYNSDSDFGDVIIAVVNMSRAHEESVLKSQRVREGLALRKSRGCRSQNLARYEVDSDYARKVRLLFNGVLNGRTIRGMAYEIGLSPATCYNVLRNERLLGLEISRDGSTNSVREPLIDLNTWRRVQAVIRTGRSRSRSCGNGISHLLRCAVCGGGFFYNGEVTGRCARRAVFRPKCKCGGSIEVQHFVNVLRSVCMRYRVVARHVDVGHVHRVVAAKAKVDRLLRAVMSVDDDAIAALYVAAKQELLELEESVTVQHVVVQDDDLPSLLREVRVHMTITRVAGDQYLRNHAGRVTVEFIDGRTVEFELTSNSDLLAGYSTNGSNWVCGYTVIEKPQ